MPQRPPDALPLHPSESRGVGEQIVIKLSLLRGCSLQCVVWRGTLASEICRDGLRFLRYKSGLFQVTVLTDISVGECPMAAVIATFAHDFATKWEMEAHIRRDTDQFLEIKDQLVELGLLGAEHGIMFSQKDKFRHMGVLRFKDAEAYKNCMEVIDGTEWDKEISRVNRFEAFAVDVYIDI